MAEREPHFAHGVVDVLGVVDYMDPKAVADIKFPMKLSTRNLDVLSKAQPYLRGPIYQDKNTWCMHMGQQAWTRTTAEFVRCPPDGDGSKLEYARAVFCLTATEQPKQAGGGRAFYMYRSLKPRVAAWMTEYLTSKFRDPASLVSMHKNGLYAKMGPGDHELCETLLDVPRVDPAGREERNKVCAVMPNHVVEKIKELWVSVDAIETIIDEVTILHDVELTREQVERIGRTKDVQRAGGERRRKTDPKKLAYESTVRRMWREKEDDDEVAKRIVEEVKESLNEFVSVKKVKKLRMAVYEQQRHVVPYELRQELLERLADHNLRMRLNMKGDMQQFCTKLQTRYGPSWKTVKDYVNVAIVYHKHEAFRKHVHHVALLERTDKDGTLDYLYKFLRGRFVPIRDYYKLTSDWVVFAMIKDIRQEYVLEEMRRAKQTGMDDFRRIWFSRGWGQRTVEEWNANPVFTAEERRQRLIERKRLMKGVLDQEIVEGIREMARRIPFEEVRMDGVDQELVTKTVVATRNEVRRAFIDGLSDVSVDVRKAMRDFLKDPVYALTEEDLARIRHRRRLAAEAEVPALWEKMHSLPRIVEFLRRKYHDDRVVAPDRVHLKVWNLEENALPRTLVPLVEDPGILNVEQALQAYQDHLHESPVIVTIVPRDDGLVGVGIEAESSGMTMGSVDKENVGERWTAMRVEALKRDVEALAAEHDLPARRPYELMVAKWGRAYNMTASHADMAFVRARIPKMFERGMSPNEILETFVELGYHEGSVGVCWPEGFAPPEKIS